MAEPADAREFLGKRKVRFWICVLHADRGRVEWRGGVAHCLEDGCTLNSKNELALAYSERGRRWIEKHDELAAERAQLQAKLAGVEADRDRLRQSYGRTCNEVEQRLGKALGCPEYGPEMFEDSEPNGDVCVGDHVPETLAAEAAERITGLAAERDRLRAALEECLSALGRPEQPFREQVLDSLAHGGRERARDSVRVDRATEIITAALKRGAPPLQPDPNLIVRSWRIGAS